MLRPPTPALLARLKEIVGPSGYIEDPAELAPHLREWRGRHTGHTPLLLRPASTGEVSAIVATCITAEVGVVPQGGNTGLVGGQIPSMSGDQILVALTRMNRIRVVDPIDDTIVVEAGCTLRQVQEAALGVNRLFPLSLASEGTCQIGGNLSTNAGGVHVLRYGNARALTLGLEVVLPDGRVWDGLRSLHKDNTGYDLKHLFLGADGTLGFITAAVLRLFPRHRHVQTVFAAVPTPEAALALLGRLRSATDQALLAFELIPRLGLELVIRHVPGTTDPLATASPWYVLTDLTIEGSRAEELFAEALGAKEVTDATLAAGSAQAAALWRLRESLSDAQRPEGGSIKHDVAVPVSRIPELIRRAIPIAETLVPGIRPVPFGHLGDGNLHFNFSQPVAMDKAAFLARWEDLNRAIHDLVHELGGSVSAEHGVGSAKRDEIARYKSPVELDLQRAIKRALDPTGIMNPGKGLG